MAVDGLLKSTDIETDIIPQATDIARDLNGRTYIGTLSR